MNNQFSCVENISTVYLSVALFAQEKERKKPAFITVASFRKILLITDILGP
jgi:hypothetical protein